MADTANKRAKTSIETECRACLAKICDDSFCVDLFRVWDPPWSGMGESIAEDLAKLANIQISVSDPYSKSICKTCCYRLQDAVNFTWSVQNSDIKLRTKHQNCIDETPWPKPIQVDKNLTSDAFNEMHVEVKQEIVTEDEYEMSENCSEQCEPNLDIKIEPEEITPPIGIQINGSFSLPEEPTDLPKINGATEYLDEGLLHDVKAEPTSDDETESVPGMPMDCMLCMKTFNTVKGLKAHVIAVHSYDNFTSHRADRTNVCSTCNRSFSTRTDLFVHETCHSKFACYVCDKKFDTFNLLTKHRSKQCMQTSVLPRLKTLDDVRRPVYYINDKKSEKSAQKKVGNLSSKKPDSLVSKATKELNPNHIKTNTSIEQLSKRKADLLESVQLKESLSAIEETISVVEKLNNASVEEISHSDEKTYVREEIRQGIKKQRPHESTENLQPEKKCSKNISNTVNTQNHKSTDAANSVEQVLESLHTSPQIKNEAESESNNVLKDNINEVGDTTEGRIEIKELEKNYVEHIIEIGNIRSVVDNETIEMGSEISKETNDIQQVKLFKSNPNHAVKMEENVIKEIQQHLLETCANNEQSTEQMNKKEQITEQNHTTEIDKELLLNEQMITLKDQSDIKENMEIQLEIHSVDKEQENAMDVDNDLEREIKMDSESDKTQ